MSQRPEARLNDSNKRLEGVFLKQRELEANYQNVERYREEADKRAADRISQMRDNFNSQMREFARQRDTHKDGRHAAETRVVELEQEFQRVSEQLGVEINGRKAADLRANDMAKNNAALRTQISSLQNANRNYTDTHSSLKNELGAVKTQLHAAQKQADEKSHGFFEMQTRATRAEDRLKTMQAQLNQLQQRVGGTDDSAVERIRKEFAEQLSTIISEKQKLFEETQRTLIQRLTDSYEERMGQLKTALKQAEYNVQKYQDENNDLARQRKILRDQLEEINQFNKVLDRSVQELTNTVEHLRKAPSPKEQRLQDHVNALQQQYSVKEQEYEALLNLKIQLDDQISAYQRLLDEEVSRMNRVV